MTKITLDKNGLAKVAGTLTAYNFDGLTGEFTGAGDEYLPQGVGLPANACTIAPRRLRVAGRSGQSGRKRKGNAYRRGQQYYAGTADVAQPQHD